MPILQTLTIVLKVVAYFTASCLVDQTLGISTALGYYFGPLPPFYYAATYAPRRTEPVTVVIPIDLKNVDDIYATAILTPQLHGANGLSQSENISKVIAAEMVNIFGVTHEIQLTANASDVQQFARNISMADSELTKTACLLPSHRWSWLHHLMGHGPLSKIFRAFVMFLLCHDYAMNRAYVVCPTMTLVAGAMFYGLQFRVKNLRKIVRLSKKLSNAEDLTLVLTDKATGAEERATRAEEAMHEMQSQYAEAIRLIDAAQNEAKKARNVAGTAKTAQEKAEMAQSESTSAEQRATTALASAKREEERLSGVTATQKITLDHARQENSELRRTNSSLRIEAEQANTASNTALERTQKKSSQEIDSLRKDNQDKLDKLKTQNQTTTKLREDVRSLKDQLKELSPVGVEKLKKQLVDEERSRKAAEKKTTDLETEMAKAERVRKSTEAERVKDVKKKMEEVEESRKAAEEKAAELQAQKDETEAVVREQISSDAATITDLKREVKASHASSDEAKGQIEVLQADLVMNREGMAAAQTAKKELQAQLDNANDKIKAQEYLLHNEFTQAMTMSDARNAAIADLETRLRDQASAMKDLETQVRDQASVISSLETQSRDQAPGSLAADYQSSTGSQELDEPQQRPAVRLPPNPSDVGTPKDADTDDHDDGFSIKGASGRRAPPTSPSHLNEPIHSVHCDHCHRFHPPPCLACPRCFKVHTGECPPGRKRVPRCPTCQKYHPGACNKAPATASPADGLDDSTPSSASNAPQNAPQDRPASNSTPPPPVTSSDTNTAPAGFGARARGGFPREGGVGRGNNDVRRGPIGTRGGRSGPQTERLNPADSFRRQRGGRGN